MLDSQGAVHPIALSQVSEDRAQSWIQLTTRDLNLPDLPPGPSLACVCDGPRSPGQKPCRKCRREYQRAYRQARRQQLQRWQRIMELMTLDNPATRAQFEAMSRTRTRFVVVQDESGSVSTAKVTAFQMRGYLTVVDERGVSQSVRLDQVIPDVGRIEVEPDWAEFGARAEQRPSRATPIESFGKTASRASRRRKSRPPAEHLDALKHPVSENLDQADSAL